MIQLYNMDCVQGMRMLADEYVDLTVTSPPYDSLRTYKGFEWDFEATARELYRVTKQGGVVVWIVNDETIKGSETGTSFKQALFFKECGFNLHDTMIWNKGTLAFPETNRYYPSFEYMFIFSKGKPKTANLISDRKNIYYGTNIHGTDRQKNGETTKHSGNGKRKVKEYGVRFNVWNMPPVQSSKERTGHPAQFPQALVADHIKSWSNDGDIVLDPFAGSGTTAVVCNQLNRRFVGFEISKEYCEIANARIRE